MRLVPIFTLLALLPLWSVASVKITEITDNYGQKVLVYKVDNPATKEALQAKLSLDPHLEVVAEEGMDNVLMVRQGDNFFVKEDAGRDCLIGAGLCLGGMAYVVAFGNYGTPQNGGAVAYVGNYYVTGGEACLVTAGWLGGCVFGLKGLYELIMPDDRTRERDTGGTGHVIDGLNISAEKVFDDHDLDRIHRYSFARLHVV